MKKLFTLLPLVALLAACGTTDPMAKRAEQERDRQERYVERTIDKAPKWMTDLPTSSSAIYAAGTSVSGDYSMALQKAKADAYGRICMGVGGTASQQTKIYRTDSEATSTEFSEMALKTSCKEVDLTGVEIAKDGIKMIAEGNRYRAYVLVVMPTGDANILRRAKDAARQRELAATRAPQALKELN
jgi:hypothetical protein